MKRLNKDEFKILYLIARSGRTNIERLSDLFKKDILLKKLIKLESDGLIKIEYKDDKIYGFMETDKGNEILESKEYENEFNENGH